MTRKIEEIVTLGYEEKEKRKEEERKRKKKEKKEEKRKKEEAEIKELTEEEEHGDHGDDKLKSSETNNEWGTLGWNKETTEMRKNVKKKDKENWRIGEEEITG